MNPLTKFEFKGRAVRTVEIDGKPFFVGRDVAQCLGYRLPQKAIIDHCKGALKWNTLTKGGNQMMQVIPEPDVYRLILRSKAPNAEAFQDWVVEEVLPAIRKTGAYNGTPPMLTQDQMCEFALRRLAGINHPVHGFGTTSKDGRLRIGYRGPTYTVTPGRIDDAAMVHASLDILANPLLPGLCLEAAK